MTIEVIGNRCSGCRACIERCPVSAISIYINEFYFEQPRIDYDKCIECGKCISVCPIANIEVKMDKFSTGVAYSKNSIVRQNGSSGGLFGVFAQEIINNGGVVYGASFDRHLKLKTTRAKELQDLDPLYKSKYLLCDTSGAFLSIKNDLEEGIVVLYCSTPCQIAALNLYLEKKYENLILVDFVCHGVGSQTLFDKSIVYTEKKIRSKIVEFGFRSKNVRNKTSSHYFFYRNSQGKTKTRLFLFSPFYNAYCKRLINRDICYNCPYAQEGRPSDITIGDFHTIEKYDTTVDRFTGISMFAVNTLKGENFLQYIENKLFIKKINWNILKSNNRFKIDEKFPKSRTAFYNTIIDESFEQAVKRFLSPWYDWMWLIYYHSPRLLRKSAKILYRVLLDGD